jgi:L-threonylcarbamoyladenylate synthase
VTVTLRVNPAQLNRRAIQQAAAAIRAGKVIAIPTDTVYGLAADAFQPAAVREVFRLKGRPENKPILLLVNSLQQVELLAARLPEAFHSLAARFWPGPLTLILPAAPSVPDSITAGTGTVAVRLPGSILVRELIGAAHVPLTGTSANRSGRPPACSAAEVKQQFPSGLPLVLDGGPAPSGLPSTLVDLTREPRIIREGAIPAMDVLSVG